MQSEQYRDQLKYGDTMLTLHHYKEPLKPLKKGFGFEGCLLNTLDGEFVQCHICGKLYKSLQAHAQQTHKILSREYKEKFGLASLTSLISENERERRKQVSIKYYASLTEAQRLELKRKNIASLKRLDMPGGTRFKIKLETKNKRGTCPDQLIAKIQEVAKNIGHTPSLSDFIHETGGQRFKHLIFTTFGSWRNALKLTKLSPKERTEGGYRHYETEELLEMIEMFAREHNTIPTATDCKRGMLPSYDVFLRRFGSMENARRKAGVYNIVTS